MNNRYTFSEFIKTAYSLLITKIIMPQARLIRRPVYLRGRKSLSGCRNLTIGHFCRFDLEGNKPTLRIGKNCEFGDMTHIVALERVDIGNNVLLASKVFISDTSHGNYKGLCQSNPLVPPNQRRLWTKPVKIGNNVWIGENAVILGGVKIGNGSVIGANSVVSQDIPENVIAAGAPAKILKRFNDEEKCWKIVR